MNRSIFDVLSLDRTKARWEDRIHELTPVERTSVGCWVKRDDAFAPLGYGGVNGGKVRQLLWLAHEYLTTGPNPGLIAAGSVRSPQLARIAAVARHFGVPCELVIGSGLETAIKHPNVQIAAALGASFHRAKAPYNPTLQKTAVRLLTTHPTYVMLPYALTLEENDPRYEPLYRFMGEQLENVPEEVTTLVIPSGSYNTTAALLYGIARSPRLRKQLHNVLLFGIGPSRPDWLWKRLFALERLANVEVCGCYSRGFADHAIEEPLKPGQISLQLVDLHAKKWAAYGDDMPERLGDIELHPTYEGKIARYLRRDWQDLDLLKSPHVLFWIVGGTASWDKMAPNVIADLGHLKKV